MVDQQEFDLYRNPNAAKDELERLFGGVGTWAKGMMGTTAGVFLDNPTAFESVTAFLAEKNISYTAQSKDGIYFIDLQAAEVQKVLAWPDDVKAAAIKASLQEGQAPFQKWTERTSADKDKGFEIQ